MRFALSQPNQINSAQLQKEITAATGLTLEPIDLVFWPPDQVEIHEYTEKDAERGLLPAHRAIGDITSHHERLVSLIAAHVPRESAHSKTRGRLRGTAAGAVGTAVENLSRPQLDDLLRCILFKLGAVDDSGAIRPLDEWL